MFKNLIFQMDKQIENGWNSIGNKKEKDIKIHYKHILLLA